MAAVILNGKKHSVTKTQSAAQFLSEHGYALKADSNANITINKTKISVESCGRYFLRGSDGKPTEIKVDGDV